MTLQNRCVNGWIILDKPLGMTSTQASSFVRRLFKADKAGHAGTLDPFATGVLPIALNEATKTIPYVVDGQKVYQFQVTWGEQKSTDDVEGEVIATSSHRPTEESIKAVLPQFTGAIQQVPPPYSAIKINGQRAYQLARAGQEFEIKPRQVIIHDFQLASLDSKDCATFTVECGTGTYIRSLARDLALSLGTVGFVSSLRRLQVGRFKEEHTISLEKLKEIGYNPEMHALSGSFSGETSESFAARNILYVREHRERFRWPQQNDPGGVYSVILPIRTVLDDIPAVSVSESDAQKIRLGQRIYVSSGDNSASQVVIFLGDEVVAIAQQGDDGWLSPKRVFPKQVF